MKQFVKLAVLVLPLLADAITIAVGLMVLLDRLT